MISAAITLLFASAGLLAVLVITHSLREAHGAWERLMREGEVLRAGIALQASARGMSLRRAAYVEPRRAFATRRPGRLAPLPRRAGAAA
ncbi:MAG: hypothetical protein ACKO01_05115 [Erythrobacter sp.]